MKKPFTALVLLAVMSISPLAKADDSIALPVISKPAILEEGTQRELTAAQIAELLPWAKDSKLFLTDLLDNIQGLSTADKIDRLAEGIEQVVGDSSPKNSELLMRYALNRGLVIKGILDKEMGDDVVGTADAKLRVLRSSILMAIRYYETDMATLSKKASAPFVLFGAEYFSFLTELNKSIFDASAQYAIQKASLEWLQWDLYRDLNNTAYAAQIVKINNALKTLPKSKLSDGQSIAYIRQMKKTAQQLNISDILAKSGSAAVNQTRQENRTEQQAQQSQQEQPIFTERNTRVDNSPLRAGDKVTTNDHYVATVTQVFPDGLVRIMIGSNSYDYNIRNLSRLTSCLQDYCNGDRVTTNDHYNATITQVFPDGLIKIMIGSNAYEYNLRNLAKPISCVSGICANDQVTTNDHYVATVTQVFPDGLAKIMIGSNGYEYNVKNLAKTIQCLGDFCNGQSVTTNDHYNATITRVFPDGLVKIMIGSNAYEYNLRNLAKPISCLSNICAGDTVLTNDHYTARVTQVFPDGLVKIMIGSNGYEYNIRNLSKAE